jgi:hypothetical protein
VDFTLPEHLPGLLAEMDEFIAAEIKPLERANMQYFDRRREFARTDLENDGIPVRAWEDLLERVVFGKPLTNQAVQWPLAELQTDGQMVRLLVYYGAWHLDRNHHTEASDKVSMGNCRANRLVCEAGQPRRAGARWS